MIFQKIIWGEYESVGNRCLKILRKDAGWEIPKIRLFFEHIEYGINIFQKT